MFKTESYIPTSLEKNISKIYEAQSHPQYDDIEDILVKLSKDSLYLPAEVTDHPARENIQIGLVLEAAAKIVKILQSQD